MKTLTPQSAPLTAHEHAWEVESRHRTSDGTVLYVLCPQCRARRVDLEDHRAAIAWVGQPR